MRLSEELSPPRLDPGRSTRIQFATGRSSRGRLFCSFSFSFRALLSPAVPAISAASALSTPGERAVPKRQVVPLVGGGGGGAGRDRVVYRQQLLAAPGPVSPSWAGVVVCCWFSRLVAVCCFLCVVLRRQTLLPIS